MSNKRVRFSGEDQVHVLPDTMKTSTREEDEQVERLAGHYKRLKTGGDVQSEIAAEAAHISRENRRRRAGRGQSQTDLLGDIEQAEEDTHPLAQEDDEEVPLEPFNLKREREEGTFSADGYWEERKQEKKQPVGKFNEKGEYVIVRDEDEDEEADAWVDSLQDVKVDEALASKLRQEQTQAAKAAYEDDALDEEDKAVYKRRIASLLNEGETVLSALRRLGGGSRQDRGRDSRRGRRQKGKAASGAALEGDAGVAGASSSSGGGGGSGAMSVENKAQFNKLTELADALLSNGEYNIYSLTREDLGGGPPEAPSSSGQASGGSVDGSKESVGSIFANAVLAPAAGAQPAAAAADEDMDDMFGDDEEPASSVAKQAGPSGAAGAAAPAAAAGGERAAGDAPAPGAPAAGSGPGSAAAADASGLEGFQYDEGSGYYYNSQLGYWYDSSTGLYGDASTGLWYSYADGQYTLVDTAAAAESQPTPVAT